MEFQELAESELTTPQIRAIAAIITANSLDEAAKKVGIGRSTIWRWRKMPEFAQALQQARRQLCQEVWAEARTQWEKELAVRLGRRAKP